MGGDSPMLRLIRESVALHAAEQVGALPTDQLKALNKALVEENDQLILAARQRKSGPWTAARAECRWRCLKEMLSLPCRDDGRETGVHVGDLAGHAGGQVRQQEGGDVAHVLDGDVAAQRRLGLDELQDGRESLMPLAPGS